MSTTEPVAAQLPRQPSCSVCRSSALRTTVAHGQGSTLDIGLPVCSGSNFRYSGGTQLARALSDSQVTASASAAPQGPPATCRVVAPRVYELASDLVTSTAAPNEDLEATAARMLQVEYNDSLGQRTSVAAKCVPGVLEGANNPATVSVQ